MPELPEVETTRRSLIPLLQGQTIEAVEIRERRLRWPISRALPAALEGQVIRAIDRRAKYLLLRVDAGTAILHLGMSGSFSQVDPSTPAQTHDHFDLVSGSGRVIRYRDPRRFGAFLWTSGPVERHRLLSHLGVEPLQSHSDEGQDFDGSYLYEQSRGRRAPLRNFLLDGRIVVGVGNIYASEACFLAGIRPTRAAGRVSKARYDRLAEAVQEVLTAAIEAGGTTLRDFHSDGQAGAFQFRLQVYGREGEPCRTCGTGIRRKVSNQRSLYYCPDCQS